MYIPKHFEMKDKDIIFDFIETHSFATLVSIHRGKPTAAHLPLILDRNQECLTGHFAKANDQWIDIEGQEILTLFQGPHHYISSSWYETNQSVPTWNYASVHVYGTIELVEDSQAVMRSLIAMTNKYEDEDRGYRIDETNEEFVRALMKGIVGFRIKIERIEGKWKLSQNHSRQRRESVIHELESIRSEDAQSIAKLMRSTFD